MTNAKPTTPRPPAAVLPSDREDLEYDLGAFGMKVFLASLSMLFAATILGYFWTRSRAESWPPPGMPPLPGGLWLSTAIILVSSATIQWALGAVRAERQASLRVALLTTSLLGLVFLVCQAVNWTHLLAGGSNMPKNLYSFLFYFLTGLHAAHVIGGLIPLGWITARAYRGAYTSADHAGVTYCAMYWHFLDVVWVILFLILVTTM